MIRQHCHTTCYSQAPKIKVMMKRSRTDLFQRSHRPFAAAEQEH